MTIRPAAVAGSFYPAEANALREEIRTHLNATARPAAQRVPKALIAPHAGYVYSGPIAASAYARLDGQRSHIRRVVLLGPAHRVPVRGLALPGASAFETPLGTVPVDAAAALSLAHLPQVVVHAGAHAHEHSLEVHLPFLQEMLGDFSLLPLVVGDATAEEVAEVLQALWGGPETLIVISSDLSHYLPYDLAVRTDARTAQAIADLDPTLDHLQACGATPVNGLLTLARRHGLRAELLDLRNSGDTAGDRRRVVGYGAWAIHEAAVVDCPFEDRTDAASTTNELMRGALLTLARGAIARQLGLAAAPRTTAAFLRARGASFVTLRTGGALRGCIGSLEARRPLGEDVEHNARAAAFSDPRFEPLEAAEFEQIRVEVSVLSAPQPMEASGLDDLQRRLRPHVDGLILRYGDRRATFLPQVWDALPDAGDFVGQLQRKAGLPVGFWHADLQVSRYTVEKYVEDEG
ncbi:MAG: AmmeMemoRadiSam system protein B [Gemmatimonadota bacterium]